MSSMTNVLALMAGASIAALASAAQAQEPVVQPAQQAETALPPAAPAPEEGGEIVVTASRITASGFSAPTPTTVVGAEDIARVAEPNIFNTIAQLPSLQGSTGATQGNAGTSGGQNGLSSFNLRGLGTIRTLTLLDGQRVVPANVTGIPDISQFPQLLIQRVDVVTGGASSSYGSDAVSGVINFVTNKTFEGFKANVQGGISDYGDNESLTVQPAGAPSSPMTASA